MPHLWHRLGWVLLAGCFCFSACQSPSTPRRSGGDSPSTSSAPRGGPGPEYWEESAVERRVQGYAHYAAGVLLETQAREAREDRGGEVLSEALGHFIQAAQADPLNEVLNLQVAGRLLQARQPERVIELLAPLAERRDSPASYWAWLALAHQMAGRNPEAIQANRAALAKDPTLLMAWQQLVSLYTEQQQLDQALEVLREATRQLSLDPVFFVTISDLYLAATSLHPAKLEEVKPDCLRLLDRAAELGIKDPLLVHRLAAAYRRLGQWEKSEAAYLDLLKRYPDAPLARESLVDIYLNTSNREAAARQLRSMLEANPGNERATYVLGALAFQEDRLEEAEDLLSRALLLQPLLEPAYYDLAGVKLSRNKPEEALAVLESARRMFPKKESFLVEFYTGLAHARAERFAEAVRFFTAAEVVASVDERERLNHQFYFQYGAACERKGDFAEAEKHLRKALELSPEFADALNYLGYMWADRGENLEEAREMIEKAVELEPENEAFLDSLGWVLYRLKQPRAALEWQLKAVQLAKEPDATLYDHLGDIHAALEEWEKAREAWEKALSIKDSEPIRRKLEGLGGRPGVSP